jgi:hypothetical protein
MKKAFAFVATEDEQHEKRLDSSLFPGPTTNMTALTPLTSRPGQRLGTIPR